LQKNECIDRSFRYEDAALSNVLRNIPESCAFCEFNKPCLALAESLEEVYLQCQRKSAELENENENLKIEVEGRNQIIAELRRQLDWNHSKITSKGNE
jgi:predicted RNase H-like nuclease (RuvC/YqgF family)